MKTSPEGLARTYVETIIRVAVDGQDEELLDLVHPEAELRPIITGTVHHGREGAAAWIKAAREALVWEPVIRRVVRVDDTTAVAIIHLHASRATQGIVDSDIAWVAEFADGLLRRARAYPSVDRLPAKVRAVL
jgi:ketosteroid isomerase-like protein